MQAFLSAFEWHNETLNIYSHFLPGMFWFYMFFSYDSSFMNPLTRFIIHFSYFSGALLGVASGFAHTFHIVNPWWANICWKLDYIGIIAINLTHQFLDNYILFAKQSTLFYTALILESMFALFCAQDILLETTKVHWGLMYPLITSTVLIIPVGLLSYDSPLAYYSIGCSIFIFIAGGVFFMGKLPERLWNPHGVFNYVNSHFFHHVCIVIAIVLAFKIIPLLEQI
jgi:adiponectin receptor